MAIYVDSGNIEEIREILEKYPYISGVTTNPSLIYKAGTTLKELVPKIRSLTFKVIFAQTDPGGVDEIVRDVEFLTNFLNPNGVSKIPFSKEGIMAILKIRSLNKSYPVCVTSVATVAQALISAEAGADYIAFYVGRVSRYHHDRYGGDENYGLKVIESISDMYYKRGFKTKILAASIKNVSWIDEILKFPNTEVTLPPSIIRECLDHEVTVKALKEFEEIFKNSPKVEQ